MHTIRGSVLLAFLLELAGLLYCCSSADAQIVRVCGVTQQCTPLGCNQVNVWGSGTIIAVSDTYRPGKSLVLGCAHQFSREKYSAIYVQGWKATLLVHEEANGVDLSLLEVDHDFGKALPVADDDLPPGAKAWAVGFGSGQVKETAGINAEDNSLLVQTVQGDSGGPVLKDRTVYGVLWGQENLAGNVTQPRARYTCARSINRFCERHGYSKYVFRSRSVTRVGTDLPLVVGPRPADPTPIAPVADPINPPPSPKIDLGPLEERIRVLEARVAVLEGKQPVPGPVGPAGPFGPRGLDGSPGRDGKPGANGRDGVTNIVLKWDDGTLIQKFDKVAAGSTVTVPIKEVKEAPK
jgi:hypothetical protein